MGDVSAEPSMEDILSSIKRIIAEDGEGAVPRTRRAARAMPPVAPASANDAAAEEVLELSELAPDPEPMAPAAPLVSPDAASASRGSLDALTRMITRPEPEVATSSAASPPLDAFVAELLRPLLREWLDAHLPDMVEAMVAREIARITGAR